MHETGFSLVEALGVEGLRQLEMLIVQVMTELMDQGPQKSPKGHHLPSLRRAHPDGDPSGPAPLHGIVQTVKFPPAPGRSHRQDCNTERTDLEADREGGNQLLTERFYGPALLTSQRLGQLHRQRTDRDALGQSDPGNLIASPVDPLLGPR